MLLKKSNWDKNILEDKCKVLKFYLRFFLGEKTDIGELQFRRVSYIALRINYRVLKISFL